AAAPPGREVSTACAMTISGMGPTIGPPDRDSRAPPGRVVIRAGSVGGGPGGSGTGAAAVGGADPVAVRRSSARGAGGRAAGSLAGTGGAEAGAPAGGTPTSSVIGAPGFEDSAVPAAWPRTARPPSRRLPGRSRPGEPEGSDQARPAPGDE